jgi:hypothetical protein
VNHRRIEVAGTPGGELDGRHPLGSDALCITFGFYIALDDTDFDFIADPVDGVFEQRRLARTGAGNEVEHDETLLVKMDPVGTCHRIVGLKQRPVNIDHH